METFLLNAKIVSNKGRTKGVTDARRVVMTDGRITHDAQVQDVYIEKPVFNVGKHSEVNFKDLYRYNVAAYRLSVLLGMDNVPMSVERTVSGKPSAVTWWLDDVAMDENGRQKQQVRSPDPARTASFLQVMQVFDELIQNRDRNGGNLLWSTDWKGWLIDHTRSFRLSKDLLKPEDLKRCERTMCDGMRRLNKETLEKTMGSSLTRGEIEALLARRDAIVRIFDQRIADHGEATVLFDLR
jgi:hypothetical protein